MIRSEASDLMRPEWHAQAACRNVGPDLFYPEGRRRVVAPIFAQAREVCETCPVQAPCLRQGMGEPWGMWGGMEPRERNRVRHLPEVWRR